MGMHNAKGVLFSSYGLRKMGIEKANNSHSQQNWSPQEAV